MIKKILAKMLFCDEKYLHWVLLHIPVGVVNVLIPVALYLVLGVPGALIGGVLALVLGIGFVAYEVTEWEIIKDILYPDIQGWLWGIGLSVGVIFLVLLCYHGRLI
jgi:hypothetical protein